MWDGQVQKMTEDGTQKGMKRVLEERGVDTHKMKADQMRKELLKFDDFNSDGVPIAVSRHLKHSSSLGSDSHQASFDGMVRYRKRTCQLHQGTCSRKYRLLCRPDPRTCRW